MSGNGDNSSSGGQGDGYTSPDGSYSPPVGPDPLEHFNNGEPTAPVAGYDKLPKGYATAPADITPDNTQISYRQAYNDIVGADQDVAPGIPQGWALVSQHLSDAAQDFQHALDARRGIPDGWKGATADAAYQNVTSSHQIPRTLSVTANAMQVLVQAFHQTMFTTKDDIVSNYNNYTTSLNNFPEQANQINQEYNSFAQAVMGNCQNNLDIIAMNNPTFDTGAPPPVNPPPPGSSTQNNGSGTGSNTSGNGAAAGSSGGAEGGGGAKGGGVPALAGGSGGAGTGGGTLTDPNVSASTNTPTASQSPTQTSPTSQGTPTDPSAATAASPTSNLSQLASQLAGPAEAAASPLQSVGQALGSAAQQAGSRGATNVANSLSKLPKEGTLGLGHKSGNGGAAGAGGGSGVHGPSAGKPAGAPSISAGTTPGRVIAAGARVAPSGAGVGAGMPGAGAPAAGQHGAAAQGAPYQSSKALRRKKNGEELIGDAEAVKPILDRPAQPEAAKPGEPTSADSDTVQIREKRPQRTSPAPVYSFPQAGS